MLEANSTAQRSHQTRLKISVTVGFGTMNNFVKEEMSYFSSYMLLQKKNKNNTKQPYGWKIFILQTSV